MRDRLESQATDEIVGASLRDSRRSEDRRRFAWRSPSEFGGRVATGSVCLKAFLSCCRRSIEGACRGSVSRTACAARSGESVMSRFIAPHGRSVASPLPLGLVTRILSPVGVTPVEWDRIRTCYLWSASPLLYPVELPDSCRRRLQNPLRGTRTTGPWITRGRRAAGRTAANLAYELHRKDVGGSRTHWWSLCRRRPGRRASTSLIRPGGEVEVHRRVENLRTTRRLSRPRRRSARHHRRRSPRRRRTPHR